MADRVLDIILRRRGWVLLCIFLLTVPAVAVLSSAEFASSIVESFVDDPQEYIDARELENLFTGNPDALIWLASVEDDSLFTQTTLAAIRAAGQEISDLAAVNRVFTLADAPRDFGQSRGLGSTIGKILLNAKLKSGTTPPQSLKLEPILPTRGVLAKPALEKLAREVLQSGGYARRFLSDDGQAHVILIELNDTSDLSPADQVELTNRIQEIARSHKLGSQIDGQGIYCSGLVPLQAYAFEEIGKTLNTLLPLGGLFISLAVLLIFRRFEVIALTLAIAAISVCWGIAIGVAAYGKFSVLMAAVPLMVLVISTADVIHLVSSYTAERSAGSEHALAIAKTFRDVGKACLLTSITTFVGFASLVMVPSNTIRQFGFSAAAGVASALVLSILLVPIFLDTLHRFGRPIAAASITARGTRAIANACLRLGTSRPRKTLIVFASLFSIAAFLTSQVQLDPDLSKRFSHSHPITRSTAFFADQFGGINSIELVLRADPETLLHPKTVEAIEAFSDLCEYRFEASHVDSIAQVLKSFLRGIDYQNATGNPDSLEHSRATIEYLRQLSPPLVNRLITDSNDQLRILIRIQPTSYLAMEQVSKSIIEDARVHFGSDIEILEKGSAPLVGRAVRAIIRGHLEGFVFCFTTIFFLIAFGLKSIRLAFISVFPNLTPLLVLGGLISLNTQVADSDILAVATLGLGLAVDDTIHFLSRFKTELARGKTCEAALKSSMEHTGLAIIRTTVILSVGFLPFGFSGYWSINMLGTYLIAVLCAAVVADLILLPAIVAVFYRRAKREVVLQ